MRDARRRVDSAGKIGSDLARVAARTGLVALCLESVWLEGGRMA
jgi:hypothetical protein